MLQYPHSDIVEDVSVLVGRSSLRCSIFTKSIRHGCRCWWLLLEGEPRDATLVYVARGKNEGRWDC